MRRYSSRKFLMTAVALGTSIIALFAGKLDGNQWVAAITLILGVYGTHQIVDEKMNGTKE